MKLVKKIFNTILSFFSRQSLKKKILIFAVILIGIFVINRAFFNTGGNGYNIEQTKRSDIIEKIDESGVVKISGQTEIYSPTNGVIEEVYVSNGENVATGQELFKVRSTATKQEQQAAYANYLTAKAALDAAKSNLHVLQASMFEKWDVFKELAESDDYEDSDGNPKYDSRALPEFHIPEKEWLAAEAKYIDQQSVIAQAQASVSSTWLLYQATQSTTVKSTADGVVANLSVVAKDSVKSLSGPSVNVILGSSSNVRPVITVADFSVIGVLLSLGESDISKVKSGDKAEIDVDPINNRIYKGIVRRADDIGDGDGSIVKYDVFIEILDRDDRLKSGMSADAVIVTKKVSGVLSVPNTAVKPYKGGKAVQIVNTKNELEFVPVQIGVRGEKRTEILKGLTEGQEIVTALTNDKIKRSGLMGF